MEYIWHTIEMLSIQSVRLKTYLSKKHINNQLYGVHVEMLIDLNCDMGESFGAWRMGADEDMLDIVTSANIACGFHAGDPDVMFETLHNARAKNVAAGAHPGFQDLAGFGRRQILGYTPQQIHHMVAYQIGAIKALSECQGIRLQHVKTHGAFGNMAAENDTWAEAVADAIYQIDPSLIMVVMPGMATETAALKKGLKVIREIYVDRAYAENGNLLSRSLPGAVIHDPQLAAERILRMIDESAILTASGRRLPAKIDSLCVHGDSPGAVDMASAVRQLLEERGIIFAPMAKVLLGKA